MESTRERTSFHEAGHIFMHLLTGIELTVESNIENDKQQYVVVHDNYDLVQYHNKDLRDDIIMCVRAGSLAEKYYCWRKCINYDPQVSGNDIWQISRIYYEGKHKFTDYESFEKHIRDLEGEMERLLTMHWSFIKIIARQLLIKKVLTVEEANKLWLHFKKVKEQNLTSKDASGDTISA
jgi:hypothetical protein